MRARRVGGEEGAYLVLYALVTIAVFAMAALVLDLSAIRQDRRAARLSADLAATAGAADLELANPTAPINACQAAWAYLVANTPGFSPPTPDCATTFAGPCVASAARTLSVTAPPFAVEIVNPVPDAHPFMDRELNRGDTTQATTAGDGDPCERLGVRVRRARDAAFGPVVGFMGATTDVHAVARSAQTTVGGTFVTVGALAPTGCDVVTLSKMLELRVGGGAGAPGIMWVDSDGTGCGGGKSILNPGGRNINVVGPSGSGIIYAWAATLGRAGVVSPASGVSPAVPTVAPRPLLRDTFDDRYNCTSSACAPNPPAINQLVATLDTGSPLGFLPFVDCSGAVPPLPGVSYLVTCTQVTGSLTFTGDVVFANSLQVTNSGCLAVNSTGCGGVVLAPRDSVVYARGDFANPGKGDVHLEQTMVYVRGRLLFDRGNSSIRWTAPLTGNFEDLLLWTENPGVHHIEEQNVLWQLEGAVFVPNGTVELRASTPLPKPVPVLRTQIHAGRLDVTGSGILALQPVASRGVISPIRTVRLIR